MQLGLSSEFIRIPLDKQSKVVRRSGSVTLQICQVVASFNISITRFSTISTNQAVTLHPNALATTIKSVTKSASFFQARSTQSKEKLFRS
jgi:hypothetical protein